MAIDRVCRIYLPLEGRLLTLLLFTVQPGILNYFALGRPDHHALILTCFILSLCATALIMNQPRKIRYYIAAALFVSIGLWTSVESLVAWFSVSASLTLLWLAKPETGYRIACFHSSVLIICSVLVVIETPALLFEETILDRLSRLHLFCFFLLACSWWALSRMR